MDITLITRTLRSDSDKCRHKKLEDVVALMRDGSKWSKYVEKYRALIGSYPEGFLREDVERMPLICPGLAMNQHRDGTVEQKYTGLMLLEVNELVSEAEIRKVKEQAEISPATLLVVTGLDGMSVQILVRGILDGAPLPTEEDEIQRFHEALYRLSIQNYKSLLSQPLSTRQPSPSDAFRWTQDPDVRFHPDAGPIRVPRDNVFSSEAAQKSAFPYALDSEQPVAINKKMQMRRFDEAMKEALADAWTEKNPEKQLNLTAAKCVLAGMRQEEAVRQACARNQFKSLTNGQIRAIVEGVYATSQPPKRRIAPMQDVTLRLQLFMSLRYDLRFNELSNGVEYRRNTSYDRDFKPVDTRVMNTMIQEANESGVEIMDRDMKRYLGSTLIRDFNAAKAYLYEHQEEWDGETDYIGQLAERVPNTNPYWREWFHTWFLGMVMQWLGWDPDHGNSVAPLLVGEQGCGKSTFGQLILPRELRDIGYKELVSFERKDEVERMLTNSLLINLDEFNQISAKTQQGFLKNLTQKSSIKGRRPYSGMIQNLPRFASFIATTNMPDALTDPSGSRRFIVAEIPHGKSIDTHTRIQYAQLYAQAFNELSHRTHRHYFTPDEVRLIEEHNATTVEARPEVRAFMETFTPAKGEGPDVRRLHFVELVRAIERQTGYRFGNSERNHLGRYLTRLARTGVLLKKDNKGYPLYYVSPRY